MQQGAESQAIVPTAAEISDVDALSRHVHITIYVTHTAFSVCFFHSNSTDSVSSKRQHCQSVCSNL